MERRRERPVDLIITLPGLPYPFTLSSNLMCAHHLFLFLSRYFVLLARASRQGKVEDRTSTAGECERGGQDTVPYMGHLCLSCLYAVIRMQTKRYMTLYCTLHCTLYTATVPVSICFYALVTRDFQETAARSTECIHVINRPIWDGSFADPPLGVEALQVQEQNMKAGRAGLIQCRDARLSAR